MTRESEEWRCEMKRIIIKKIFALTVLFLFGCVSDPLTEVIKKYDYAPVIPISSTMHIGDIYETKGLKEPYIFMKDIMAEHIQKIMEESKEEVSIPDVSKEEMFTVSAEADIVGQAETDLLKYNIKKFKVKFNGVVQYRISKVKFEEEIYSRIKKEYPDRSFDKRYVIVALLKISELEYEFFDNNGGRIFVTPGGEIEKVLKAKLGVGWSATENNTLKINEPRYIGYRMAQLNEVSYEYVKGLGHKGIKVELIDIPSEELRKSLK